ncbi:MAG: hypothetical protein EAZ20_01200 [Bacteroidetes bacterium]|nr:MAG: hypothetical protein EAZ20_01200 [Bacteroidota bacterium]
MIPQKLLDHQNYKMIRRILLFCILFLFISLKSVAQNYERDFQALYQKCTQTRLDSVHRLIVGFLRKYEVSFVRKGKIIQTPKKFYKFCDEFKAICTKNNQQALLRRLQIIELIDKLKYENTSSAQTEKAFYKLFEELVATKDYSAALSCLLEAGLIQGFYGGNKQNIQVVKMLFFAEKFAEKHALSKDIALQSVLRIIGYCLWEFDIPELATQYFKKSLQTGFSTRDDSLIVLNGIGINYQKLNNFQASNQYFEQASQVAIQHKNSIFEAVIKGNMAVNLLKTGDFDLAYQYALQDKNTSLQNQLWENAVGAMYWLVQIELKRQNFAHAKILLDSLEGVAGKIKDKSFKVQKRQKEATYLYWQALKDTEKTFVAYREFVHYDSLFQEYANKNKISELKLTAEVQLYAQEMEQKEQEKHFRNKLFVGVVIVLLGIMAVLAWYFFRKIKRVTQNNLVQTQEIKALRQQLFEQLANINHQNTALEGIITHENVEKQEAGERLEFDAENVIVKFEDIQYLRNFNLAYKEQWSVFKESFLKIYPTFEEKITKQIGTVSNAELRLLMLHKLGLNNPEIAKSLLISPESVRTGKYRLYKKFGISSNEELDKML